MGGVDDLPNGNQRSFIDGFDSAQALQQPNLGARGIR